MSPGHMIPMIDMAKLFSRHGVSATVVTTPGNEPLARPAIDRADSSIDLLLVPFPSPVAHLLQNSQENLTFMPKSDHAAFFQAFFALRDPLEDLLRLHKPDCIVSDSMYTWTADSALALGIPRLIFHGHGLFPLCVHESVELHSLHNNHSDDIDGPFLVEGLPDRIEMKRTELSTMFDWQIMLDALREAEEKSYGVVVNSFYALEPAYAELYREKPGRRAWYVGPVSLCSIENIDRGQKIDEHEVECCLKWIDSMAVDSVVYVCFGSLNEFDVDQLLEIAHGLEDSGHPFVWVVRNSRWLDEEFEERVKGRGVILRGWAPQTLILNLPAVGGFVTHCGWNSTVEAISAGVPMVAWPVEYEQFVNEKLIVQVLGLGVRVERGEGAVRRDAIAKAVREVMGGGEEAEERRNKASKYAAMAKAAMEEGGSSYMDTASLIHELQAASSSTDLSR